MRARIVRRIVQPADGNTNTSRLVGDEWFATGMAADDAPDQLYGWLQHGFYGSASESDWELEWEATGGPNGRPCLRETVFISADGFTACFEHADVFSPAQCTFGDDFYIRFSFRPAAATGQEQKVFQLYRGNDHSSGRCILTCEDWGSGYAWRVQKDGGVDPIQHPDSGAPEGLLHTNWQDIQIHGRYSSALDVADGMYSLYYNNDTFASPTATITGIVLNTTTTANANDINFMGLHQQMLGTKTFRWADFRIGPTFDANFYATGAGA